MMEWVKNNGESYQSSLSMYIENLGRVLIGLWKNHIERTSKNIWNFNIPYKSWIKLRHHRTNISHRIILTPTHDDLQRNGGKWTYMHTDYRNEFKAFFESQVTFSYNRNTTTSETAMLESFFKSKKIKRKYFEKRIIRIIKWRGRPSDTEKKMLQKIILIFQMHLY